jgi:hypothetical protein
MTTALLNFAFLLAWHANMDYVAQIPRKHERWWAMALHAGAHGVGPWVLFGWQFALAEMAAHALIDTGKGKGWYTTVVDQSLHVLCKVVWVLLA